MFKKFSSSSGSLKMIFGSCHIEEAWLSLYESAWWFILRPVELTRLVWLRLHRISAWFISNQVKSISYLSEINRILDYLEFVQRLSRLQHQKEDYPKTEQKIPENFFEAYFNIFFCYIFSLFQKIISTHHHY